jgi:hypothetical protein
VRAIAAADMKTDLVTMSTTGLERLALMRRIAERRTTQREAAEQLGLGVRQVELGCPSAPAPVHSALRRVPGGRCTGPGFEAPRQAPQPRGARRDARPGDWHRPGRYCTPTSVRRWPARSSPLLKELRLRGIGYAPMTCPDAPEFTPRSGWNKRPRRTEYAQSMLRHPS